MQNNTNYKYNQTIVKKIGTQKNGFKLKLIRMNVLRAREVKDSVNKPKSKKGTVNSKKLQQNLSRAKRSIYEMAVCNDWDWFITITLSQNRNDITKRHKQLAKWIANFGYRHNLEIKYLLVPELHSDGVNWHFHGLISGLPVTFLEHIKDPNKTTWQIAKKIKKGDIVYKWTECEKKFGLTDVETIQSVKAVGLYISKHINDNLSKCISDLNAHLYYHSRGLKVGKVLKCGVLHDSLAPDYTNDYCSITTFKYDTAKLNGLLDKIY